MSRAGEDRPKISNVRAPALLDKDAASGIATTTGVDMQGFDRVAFDIGIGTAVSGAEFDAWVVESHESNMANAVNVAGTGITQVTASANMNATTRTIDVFRPNRRYAAARLKTATQNITTVYVNARQYRGTGVIPPTATTDHEYVSVAAN
jgi:hypothetical protein